METVRIQWSDYLSIYLFAVHLICWQQLRLYIDEWLDDSEQWSGKDKNGNVHRLIQDTNSISVSRNWGHSGHSVSGPRYASGTSWMQSEALLHKPACSTIMDDKRTTLVRYKEKGYTKENIEHKK
jgi:hypothetical protein